MALRPCPNCQKPIPARMTLCPYCKKDEAGKETITASALAEQQASLVGLELHLRNLSSHDAFTRQQAEESLTRFGPSVVPELLRQVEARSIDGLGSVAKVLGRLRDRRALPLLKQLLQSSQDDYRASALWALTQFRDAQILESIAAQTLQQEPTLQSYIAFSLGSFQDPAAISVLSKLVTHQNAEVAFQAAYALGDIGDRAGVPALRKGLKHKEELVRAASVVALKRIGVSTTFATMSKRNWAIGICVVALCVAAGLFFHYR